MELNGFMIGPEIKTLFKIKVGSVFAEHPVKYVPGFGSGLLCVFDARVDHLDDGGDLLLAVRVEQLAVLPLARLPLLQVLDRVLQAVVRVLLDVVDLKRMKLLCKNK